MLIVLGTARQPWQALLCAIALSGATVASAAALPYIADRTHDVRNLAWPGPDAPSMSGNGRWIAFASRRNDLITGDSEDHWDVFVRDAVANNTVRISQDDAGVGMSGASTPTLTPDGRFVAYRTSAVMIHDRDSDRDGAFDEPGAIDALLLPNSSDIGIVGDYQQPPTRIGLSSDGRFVAYLARISPADPETGHVVAIVLHDRDSDADGAFDEVGATLTTRVATRPDFSTTRAPVLSGDGTVLAFAALRPGQDPVSPNAIYDTWIYRRADQSLTRVQRAGIEPTARIWPSDFDSIGSVLLVGSGFQDLDTTQAEGQTGAYIYTLATGSFTLLVPVGNGMDSIPGELSPDGRYALVSVWAGSSYGPARIDRLASNARTMIGGVTGNGQYPTMVLGTISNDGRYAAMRTTPDATARMPRGATGVGEILRYDLNSVDLSISAADAGNTVPAAGVFTIPFTISRGASSTPVTGVWAALGLPSSQFSWVDGTLPGASCYIEDDNNLEDGTMWCGPVSLTSGQQLQGQFRIHAEVPIAGTSVLALVYGEQAEPTFVNNSDASAGSYAADVRLTVTKPSSRKEVGDKVKYTFAVTNVAPSVPAQNVVLRFTPPLGTTLIGVTAPAGVTCTNAPDQGFTCQVGTIASGVTRTIYLTVKAFRTGTVRLVSSVTHSTPDRNPANHTSTVDKKIYR